MKGDQIAMGDNTTNKDWDITKVLDELKERAIKWSSQERLHVFIVEWQQWIRPANFNIHYEKEFTKPDCSHNIIHKHKQLSYGTN